MASAPSQAGGDQRFGVLERQFHRIAAGGCVAYRHRGEYFEIGTTLNHRAKPILKRHSAMAAALIILTR
jgi:hypothetical protein